MRALPIFNAANITHDYSAGSNLFVEQQAREYDFVIERGRVKISTTSREGKIVIVRIAGEGDVVGLSAAMSNRPYDVSAEALERCLIKTVRIKDFLQLIAQYPQAAKAATDSALSKYQLVFQELGRLSLPETIAGRIARLLLEWGNAYRQHYPTHDRITVGLTHEELAEKEHFLKTPSCPVFLIVGCTPARSTATDTKFANVVKKPKSGSR